MSFTTTDCVRQIPSAGGGRDALGAAALTADVASVFDGTPRPLATLPGGFHRLESSFDHRRRRFLPRSSHGWQVLCHSWRKQCARLSLAGCEAGAAGDRSAGLLVPAEGSMSSGGSIPSGPSPARAAVVSERLPARGTAKKPSRRPRSKAGRRPRQPRVSLTVPVFVEWK